MTFTDAAAQSKTMATAWGDLVAGFGKRELWFHLGWQDIKQRYRRSVLGPFWITIATGATAVAMGPLYSKLFKLPLEEHLPYVTLGLIIWNLINASILEGADVFIANEGLIKQLPTPLSVHVYRLVWRQIILFGHNMIIFVVIAIIFPQPWKWTDLAVIPALPDRAELRVGSAVLRHPGHPVPRHQPATVQPGPAALLHDADHLERVTLQQQGAGVCARSRAEPAAALPRHRAGPPARRRSGGAPLGRGHRADHHRLDVRRACHAAVPSARAYWV